ncbi:hypothetical protein [Leuconostoc citreum]|uniref:hypothetical protein n=1 Tax=Leuconostoc citreum TaxID=33964 RepID=UPI0032E017DC
MKGKIIYIVVGVLAFGVLLVMTYNGQQRAKINEVQKAMSKIDKQNEVTKQATKQLETNYNEADEKAKFSLIEFAKYYYTFASQSQYDKRFEEVKDDLQLSDENKKQLFSDGRDDTGGSKIDNLGIRSVYDSAVGYTSEKKDDLIETLATVIIRVTSDTTKTVRQPVLIHGWYDTKLNKFVSIKVNDLQ